MNDDLSAAILDGNLRAAARLMRLIDDRAPQAPDFLTSLLPHTGQAYVLGITGNPGSGKSTLVDHLISGFRQQGQTVGCIAIDPTSPFSGGAILGDRVRMQRHADDDGVFIRSVATRGNMGGLSRSTPAMLQVMDAMGMDVVLIETVGVGQDEIEIVRLADTSIVVLVPGLGDDIQADKAGLLEIADVFVLNKADLAGIRHLKREIQTMLNLNRATDGDAIDSPKVLSTIATSGEGISELLAAIDKHRLAIEKKHPPEDRQRRRYTYLIRAIARTEIDFAFDRLTTSPQFDELVDDVVGGDLDPYRAAHQLTRWLAD